MLTFEGFLGFWTEQWVWLSLIAALGYAIVGFIDEWLLDKHQKIDDDGRKQDAAGKLVIISGIFGFVLSLVFAVVALFTGGIFQLMVSESSILLAFAAGALEVAWLIPYLYAMQRSGALSATPLFQTIPVFSLILGLTVFGEIPEGQHIIGALIIVTGSFLLNFKIRQFHADFATLALMALASGMISLEYFFFKDAATSDTFMAAAFWSGLGMLGMSAAVWVIWPPYRRQFEEYLSEATGRNIAIQFSNEGLNTASALASQLAIARGPSVMLVASLNAFHPVFTLVIGWILALTGSQVHRRELSGSDAYRKSIAIVMIALGTAVISLAD